MPIAKWFRDLVEKFPWLDDVKRDKRKEQIEKSKAKIEDRLRQAEKRFDRNDDSRSD